MRDSLQSESWIELLFRLSPRQLRAQLVRRRRAPREAAANAAHGRTSADRTVAPPRRRIAAYGSDPAGMAVYRLKFRLSLHLNVRRRLPGLPRLSAPRF